MEDSKFWLTIWKMVFGTVCVVVVSIGGCQSYENKQIATLVQNGTTPMQAACAITPTFIERSVCAIVSTK